MRNNQGILRQARIDEESLLLLERAAHCYIRCLPLSKGFDLILPERSGHSYMVVLGFKQAENEEATMIEGEALSEAASQWAKQVMETARVVAGNDGYVYIPMQKNHRRPFGVVRLSCDEKHNEAVDEVSGSKWLKYPLDLGRSARLSPRLISEPLFFVSSQGARVNLNSACEDIEAYFGQDQVFSEIFSGAGFTGGSLEAVAEHPCKGIDIEVEGFSLMVTTCPILTKAGSLGNLVMLSDTTEVRDMQQEVINKSTVIREIHHRVKNNLQTIASLLQLQSRRAGNTQVEKALAESINRISSIALIHEALSHEGKNTVNIKECIRSIMEMVLSNLLDSGKSIRGELRGQDIFLNSSQASHISLCVTELLLNAVEHAFVVRKKGNILATLEQIGAEVSIVIEDDGVGFQGKKTKGNSLGLQIIEMITAENLKGSFKLEAHTYGSKAEIRFPL